MASSNRSQVQQERKQAIKEGTLLGRRARKRSGEHFLHPVDDGTIATNPTHGSGESHKGDAPRVVHAALRDGSGLPRR